MVHTKERQFSCGIFDKTFKTNRELKQHKKIHTDEKLQL